eukprot:3783498-Pyramimonas_sp.AAC.1
MLTFAARVTPGITVPSSLRRSASRVVAAYFTTPLGPAHRVRTDVIVRSGCQPNAQSGNIYKEIGRARVWRGEVHHRRPSAVLSAELAPIEHQPTLRWGRGPDISSHDACYYPDRVASALKPLHPPCSP